MDLTPLLTRAVADKHASVSDDGKRQKITYNAVNVTENFGDPEEKVRAEFWAELIYEYGYDPRRIGVEVTIPDRTDKDRADLLIFRDDERKRPYAVIECKREEISDAEYLQAIEQAFGNSAWQKLRAEYVMVVAGRTRTVYDVTGRFGIMEREQNVIADLPKLYKMPVEWRFTKGEKPDIQPVQSYELKAILGKCQQTLWGGGRLSPTAAFGELCKIIFVKIQDETAKRRQGEPYQFQIKTFEPPHTLAGRIKTLYAAHRAKDPEVFSEDIRVGAETLSLVVRHLESINLNATQLDVKGEAFQKFMGSFFKGDAGQYYTPTPLVQFAVKMVRPTSDDKALDPACGSGGFLLEVLDAVRREANDYHKPNTTDHFRHWHDFAAKNLYGIEINDEIARVAKMNMIIHDDGHTNVIGEDSLERLNQIRERHKNEGFTAGSFDLVVTNPPFGAVVSKTERPYLEDYELGNSGEGQKRRVRNNQKTEILFLERIAQFLKLGTGRAAVVVPDGILTNASLQYVRDYLLETYQLKAVVSLPQYAFSHFGAGVKSSILFLRRRAANEKPSDNEPIFMAAPERIGYDATGRVTDSDLEEVERQYRAFEKNPEPFFV